MEGIVADQGNRTSVGKLAAFAFLLGIVPQAMIEAAITAALPEIARDLGLNGEFAAQMMMGMGALGLTFGALFSGWVLERLGSRHTYVGALILVGVFGGAGLVVQNAGLLFASRVIAGFAASCIVTACMWGISSEIGKDSRARSFGFAGAIGGASAIASVIIGGYLTQHLGWRFAFVQFVVIALVILPIVLAGVQQKRPEGIPAGRPGYFKRMVPLYLQILILFSIIGMFSMQLPFMLNEGGLIDAGARSLIQAIPGIGVIVGGAIFGLAQQRFGATWTLVLSTGLFALGLLLIATNRALVPLAIGAGGTGLCMGMSMPYFYHSVSERAGPAAAGRYLGYLSAFSFFGVFANPILFEPLKAAIGIHAVFFVSAAIIAVMTVIAAARAAREPSRNKAGV